MAVHFAYRVVLAFAIAGIAAGKLAYAAVPVQASEVYHPPKV